MSHIEIRLFLSTNHGYHSQFAFLYKVLRFTNVVLAYQIGSVILFPWIGNTPPAQLLPKPLTRLASMENEIDEEDHAYRYSRV